MGDPDKLLTQLRQVVGDSGIVDDEASRSSYLNDELGQYAGKALAVVRPASTEEVAGVVKVCARAGVAMVPHGGNTGYCGGATPGASGRQGVGSL